MKARLIRVGNSKGLRIPKPLIEQSGLRDDVEITLKGDSLVIRTAHKPREGWAEAFQEMAEAADDVLLDGALTTEWDDAEWER